MAFDHPGAIFCLDRDKVVIPVHDFKISYQVRKFEKDDIFGADAYY
jgi:hypothetical protein